MIYAIMTNDGENPRLLISESVITIRDWFDQVGQGDELRVLRPHEVIDLDDQVDEADPVDYVDWVG